MHTSITLLRPLALAALLCLLNAGITVPAGATPTPATAAGGEGLPSPFAADAAIAAEGERIRRLPGGVRDKADAVLKAIFDPDRGLGFEYASYPTRTAAEAFHERQGNCLSLVNLYLALARSAGLDAFPMEVEAFQTFDRRGGTVVRSTHVVGGLSVNGMLLSVDFLPDRPKTYNRVDRISDRRHAALVHNARASEAMLEGLERRAAALYQEALRLDPDNVEAWNNYGVLAKRQGDLATARQRYETALTVDPGFLPALNNLTTLERVEGHAEAAAALAERALRQKHQNPYFLTTEAIHQANLGDLDGARDLLLRARRIDPEIPDVHLALGRVELARGNEAQAEHHFAAARKRGRPLPDAYRDKLDAKIGKLEKLAAVR